MSTRKTSELGYYVRGAGREVTGLGPNSAPRARHIMNNLDHLQDEACQSYANLAARAGASWTQATTTPGTYSLLDELPPIPILPLRRQSDGSSCRLVVTIKGACSAVGKVATVLVTLVPMTSTFSGFPVDVAPATATVQFASTTLSEKIVTIYAPRVSDDWLLPGLSGLDGAGVVASVRMYAGQLELWGTGEDVTAHPTVASVAVRGWVG